MKLLSWNVFNENADAQRIDACLDVAEPDVICLQEALPQHLERLQARYEHVVSGRDYIQRGKPCYLAIASRLPLVSHRVYNHYPDDKPHPSLFSRRSGWVEFLDSLSATIEAPGGDKLQIINLHTSAATGPGTRLAEIEAVAEAHLAASGKSIVAGDFNTFSNPWLAILLALPFGYRLSDIAIHEHRAVEAWWRAKGFAPMVKGVTMPRWRLQLDQVFLRDIRALSAEILTDSFGSDHLPILIETDAPGQ